MQNRRGAPAATVFSFELHIFQIIAIAHPVTKWLV
jgi:hypothetical protein